MIIVDDQQHIRQSLKALLASEHELKLTVIAEAANGQDLSKIVQMERPDLILMDVRMPIVDGIEAARSIKSQFQSIKIILLSVSPSYKRAAMAAGADLFLAKGTSPEHLLAAIRELFVIE